MYSSNCIAPVFEFGTIIAFIRESETEGGDAAKENFSAGFRRSLFLLMTNYKYFFNKGEKMFKTIGQMKKGMKEALP